jgi:hypothetical protein
MASTVQDLINGLNEIEDKTQHICFQYYLKEHFEYMDEDISDAAWTYACERAQSDEYFPSTDELYSYVLDGIDNDRKAAV